MVTRNRPINYQHQPVHVKKPLFNPKDVKSGDWRVQCDRCGMQFYGRQCSLEWTGLFVCPACLDHRNVQEFLKVPPENPSPPISRPVVDADNLGYCSTNSAVVGIGTVGCMIVGTGSSMYDFNNPNLQGG